MTGSRPHIVVIGSINLDLVSRMARLPRPGETLHGDDFRMVSGGKGANQAVAAARLGARVTMIGRVGDDPFGQVLRDALSRDGIDTQHVITTANCSSGVATINVEASGANAIVVVAGANGQLTADDLNNRKDVIASADVLLLQLESPLDTVAAAIQIARAAGVRTILDPAPAPTGALPATLRHVDLLSPNQTEAEALTGIVVDTVKNGEQAARRLQQGGAGEIVLKLGELGALVCSLEGDVDHIMAPRVTVVDTTAAGDAFTAALGVALSEGKSLTDAARFACATGTLACTVFGAQPAMPDRSAVEECLRQAW